MIDSINLNIKNMILDLQHLKHIGIRYVKCKNKITISFKYKNVKFVYYIPFRNLAIETTAKKILNKTNITLSDKDIFKMKLNNIVNEISNTYGIEYRMHLTRIDYFVDLKVDELKKIYIKLLKKHKSKFKYMKENEEYPTSKYVRTKKETGQRTLNFYDKEQEIEDKKYMEPEWIYKTYQGIIRLEIQNYKAKLKRELKVNNIKRSLDVYWTKESMERYYFELLESYLYKGSYYEFSLATDKIQNTDYSKIWKEKLIGFLLEIMIVGIDNIKQMKYSDNTIKGYIKKLNELKINPILLNEECQYPVLEGLYSLARKKAEADYFI